jgi:hypothetical protein
VSNDPGVRHGLHRGGDVLAAAFAGNGVVAHLRFRQVPHGDQYRRRKGESFEQGRVASDQPIRIGDNGSKGLTTLEFPTDDNGDALRRMQASGDDLSLPRNVDFTVVFAKETKARRFAKHFHDLGYQASVELTRTAESLPWDVVIIKNMIPAHSEIGRFEDELQAAAEPLGGKNDGWGCFSEGM